MHERDSIRSDNRGVRLGFSMEPPRRLILGMDTGEEGIARSASGLCLPSRASAEERLGLRIPVFLSLCAYV